MRCNELEIKQKDVAKYVSTKIETIKTEFESVIKEQQSYNKEFRNLQFYVDKIYPVKSVSQTFNILHNVIIDKNEYNNLVCYE